MNTAELNLVSIIMPLYNAEPFIFDTLKSIQNQTYTNFEVLVCDDISTDRGPEIVKEVMKSDERIKFIETDIKIGAAGARNKAISLARGRYIAFLDSDDLWDEDKLKKMINFIESNGHAFVYHDYRVISQEGDRTLYVRTCPSSVDFKSLLYNTSSIGCLTVVYDSYQVGLIQIPLLKKRNDTAMWQLILRKGFTAYKLPEVLASHRYVSNSLSRSSSKFKLLKHHYILYKKNLNMNTFQAIYYSLMNAITSVVGNMYKKFMHGKKD